MADPNRASVDRRTLLRGVGGGAVAAGWLVACGSDGGSASSAGTPAASGGGNGGGGNGGGGTGGGSTGGGGAELVASTDVQVGGGVIIEQKYVVTQPTRGDFHGFSAICTHMGCPVASVSGGTINCNCHGSQFSIADGSVVTGPATQPLPQQAIALHGGEITLA